MEKFKQKYNVQKLYAFHEAPKDELTVEFGWVNASEIALGQPIVISEVLEHPERNAATALSDYAQYFERYVSMTASEFIARMAPSPKELGIYWSLNFPNAVEGQDKFFLNLAYLIRDHKPFEMFGTSYRVIQD